MIWSRPPIGSRLLFILCVSCIVLIALPVVYASPGTSAPEANNSEDDDRGKVIALGGIGPLTGWGATFGKSAKNGLQLAVDQWNVNGGVLGARIVLAFADDKGEPIEGVSAFTRLIQRDKVVAIVGAVTSSITLAGAPIAQAAKIPVISPTSTNAKATWFGDYVFRACFIDSAQGVIGARFAYTELDATVAGVIFDIDSEYSKNLAESFKDAFEDSGGQVVAYEGHPSGTIDFVDRLQAILAFEPDVLYCPDYYNDVPLIAKQARELGYDGPIVGGDGFDSPDLVTFGGEAVNNCFFTNHFSPNAPTPVVAAFVKSYKVKYDVAPDAIAALAYDAGNLMLSAIKSAGTTDGEAIRNALAAISLDTVTGRISFNANRDPVKPAVIIEIKNGKQVYRATVYPYPSPR